MWEICSLGLVPYSMMSNEEAMHKVFEEGYRLSMPVRCSEELYSIMKSCWKIDPQDRPTFKAIHQNLLDSNRGLFEEDKEGVNENDPGIYVTDQQYKRKQTQVNKTPV